MTDAAIETIGLRKSFGRGGRRIAALDGLDLTVERGGVHGLLGPTGSGKSTLLRILTGLTRPDSGEVRIMGRPLLDQTPTAVTAVGAMIEEPLFCPDIGARRNLMMLARSAGIPRARVGDVLTGLDVPPRTRVARLTSLQRQLLGIAAALLRDTDVIVLDEPMHGVDPGGRRAVRDLITTIADDGVTVLLASHNLTDVEEVCDAVSIIGEGRLLAAGRVTDLLGERSARTRVEVADPDAAERLLLSAGFLTHREGEAIIVEGHDRPARITRLLADRGHYVTGLTAVRPDLSTLFLELTGSAGGSSTGGMGSTGTTSTAGTQPADPAAKGRR